MKDNVRTAQNLVNADANVHGTRLIEMLSEEIIEQREEIAHRDAELTACKKALVSVALLVR